MPHDFPPWHTVYDQTRRWLDAGCFEDMVLDLRELLRLAAGREIKPTAAIFDSRPPQSTPESGGRAAYDGAKRRMGSKVHMAVDTLGHLLSLHVTPANVQDRARVAELVESVQRETGKSIEAEAAEAKRGFVLLPRRWVVERSFGWAARFRRLARDYERLATTLAGLHYVAYAILMLRSSAPLLLEST